MSFTKDLIEAIVFNRTRTLRTLDEIEKEADAQAALGFRAGPGRAHLAWQLMHIAITEDVFASERLAPNKKGKFEDVWPRFRGGSTPDDEIPTAEEIRTTLDQSREGLLETLAYYDDSRLEEIPPPLKSRNLTFRDVLLILSWHEAHHHGQAHLTFNLYKASLAPKD